MRTFIKVRAVALLRVGMGVASPGRHAGTARAAAAAVFGTEPCVYSRLARRVASPRSRRPPRRWWWPRHRHPLQRRRRPLHGVRRASPPSRECPVPPIPPPCRLVCVPCVCTVGTGRISHYPRPCSSAERICSLRHPPCRGIPARKGVLSAAIPPSCGCVSGPPRCFSGSCGVTAPSVLEYHTAGFAAGRSSRQAPPQSPSMSSVTSYVPRMNLTTI